MKGLKRILLPAFTLIALTSCEGMGSGSGLFKHESQENDTITIKNGGTSMVYTDATFLKDGTKVSDEEVAKNGRKLDLFVDCSWVFEETSEDVYKFTLTILSDWHKDKMAWGDSKVTSQTFKAGDDFTYSITTMKDDELIEDDSKTFENLQNAVIEHDKIFEQLQNEYFVLTYAKDVEYKDNFLDTVEKYATSNKIPVYLVAFDNNDSIGETVGAEHFDSSVATCLEQIGVRSYDDFKYTDTPVLYHFETKQEQTTTGGETEAIAYKEITEVVYGQDKIANYIDELSPVFE